MHCHIDQYSDDEIEEILLSKENNVKVVGAAMNKVSGDRLLALKSKYPKLDICLGIHPEYPEYFNDFEEVKKQIIANKDKIVAIGEVGLPYYSLENLDKYKKEKFIEDANRLLIKFLDLAKELNLPVILHAIEDTAVFALDELKKRNIKSALFHWFEGAVKVLKEIINEGYFVSVSPEVMYNEKYSEFVKNIPIEHIVLESDGPWEYNGEKGKPLMVVRTIAYLSKERNINKPTIEKIVGENASKLFHGLTKK